MTALEMFDWLESHGCNCGGNSFGDCKFCSTWVKLRRLLEEEELLLEKMEMLVHTVNHAAPGAFANGVGEWGMDEGEYLTAKLVGESVKLLQKRGRMLNRGFVEAHEEVMQEYDSTFRDLKD